jgi:enterochelin esterase-like enzyme
MKRRTLFALAAGPAGLWSLGSARAQPLPEVGTGRIERIEFTAPREVGARSVDVWLPADYSPLKRYQVLYMHDGQNLFDGRHAYGGKSWQADMAVSRLVKAGRIADTIIVGVWNAGVERYAEYYPEKALAFAPETARREYVDVASNGRSKADAYLRFVVEELKPAIDQRFATRPGPQNTFLVGTSMGALVSIYAPAHLMVAEVLRERGYTAADALTPVMPGTGHNEADWAARLEVVLGFLMGSR